MRKQLFVRQLLISLSWYRRLTSSLHLMLLRSVWDCCLLLSLHCCNCCRSRLSMQHPAKESEKSYVLPLVLCSATLIFTLCSLEKHKFELLCKQAMFLSLMPSCFTRVWHLFDIFKLVASEFYLQLGVWPSIKICENYRHRVLLGRWMNVCK